MTEPMEILGPDGKIRAHAKSRYVVRVIQNEFWLCRDAVDKDGNSGAFWMVGRLDDEDAARDLMALTPIKTVKLAH